MIGAGAGGVEIALAMKYRLAVCRDRVRVQLVTGAGSIMPGHGMRARSLVKNALLRQGVRLVEGVVRHLERDSAQLEDGGVLPSDATMLVTGAAAEAWPGESGLATDERGFIVVTPNLQSASHPFVFAAGDAATFVDTPRAKSGVYAVRAGPPLAANLIATLDGRSLAPFKPQRRALYLISTGPRHAVASWGQLAVAGNCGVAVEGPDRSRLHREVQDGLSGRVAFFSSSGASLSCAWADGGVPRLRGRRGGRHSAESVPCGRAAFELAVTGACVSCLPAVRFPARRTGALGTPAA